MTLGEIFSPLTAVFKLILSFFGRGDNHPHKRLEARLLMRGIVSELPDDIPLHIYDESGTRHKGVYIVGLLIWNKGNQPVINSDFIQSAPLQVQLEQGTNIVGARILPVEDQTECSVTITALNILTLNFDCVNPKEYLVVPMFITGNPMTDVKVTGRIIGQESPIDHTAEEVRASIRERLSSLLVLIIILNALPGFFIGGGFILKNYGISTLLQRHDSIPQYLMLPFGLGAMILLMFVFSRIMYWYERRQHPEGYPLCADLEPPLLENIRGLMRTVFKAKKQRVSISLFDWGKPVLIPNKKVKRRTIDDWIE